MACGACGSSKAKAVTYVHTAPGGAKTAYRTEVEAKAAVARKGGTYAAQ